MIVVGDAAHSFLPYAGQGGNQAIEDAAVLAICLELAGKRDVPLALRVMEKLRYVVDPVPLLLGLFLRILIKITTGITGYLSSKKVPWRLETLSSMQPGVVKTKLRSHQLSLTRPGFTLITASDIRTRSFTLPPMQLLMAGSIFRQMYQQAGGSVRTMAKASRENAYSLKLTVVSKMDLTVIQ